MENKWRVKIAQYINTLIDLYSDSETVYRIIQIDLSLSDEDIAELGYDWILPKSNETEEPLKEYTFVWRETLSGQFTIQARSEEEAWRLIEQEDVDQAKLNYDNGEFTLVDVH